MQSIKWCSRIRDGIKITESSEIISISFLEQAKKSLIGAHLDFRENDLLWSTVKIYYSEYYSICAFLSKIGIKCENHSCSVILAKELLKNAAFLDIVNEHRKNRIDSQYYLRTGKRREVENMLKYGKRVYSLLSNIIMSMTDSDAKKYRKKCIMLINS